VFATPEGEDDAAHGSYCQPLVEPSHWHIVPVGRGEFVAARCPVTPHSRALRTAGRRAAQSLPPPRGPDARRSASGRVLLGIIFSGTATLFSI
jgi:hypothetical protein